MLIKNSAEFFLCPHAWMQSSEKNNAMTQVTQCDE